MKQKFFAVLTILWFLATGAAAPVRMTPVKIADGVYMFQHSQGSGNSTVVITDDGVLVFDFHIDNADQTFAGIRKLTDKKVKYLISSHSAADHASGAWHFREDKPIYIATKNQIHDLQMQELEEFNERKNSNDPRNAGYKGRELVRPDIGFDGTMTLYFGGLTFQVTAEGRGPQHRRSHGLYPPKTCHAHGRSVGHRDSSRARRVGRRFLFQRQGLDS